MADPQRKSSRSANRLIIPGIVAILAVLAIQVYQRRDQRFVGTIPQDFPDGGAWIGAEPSLRLAGLRGKVVLMQFSFVSCPYCREMDPYLQKWQQEFKPDGFEVIEIDDGGSDSFDDVRNWAAAARVSYPVYYDTGGRMTRSYRIRSFPTLLLVGRDGKVVWEGSGWSGAAGVANLEKEVRNALKQ